CRSDIIVPSDLALLQPVLCPEVGVPLPAAFSAVPDWFSWENQGVDNAVADITGSGRPDLLVLMVDNGPEQNRGVYRMGRDLDTAGVVTGGWPPWADVPDWFPGRTRGPESRWPTCPAWAAPTWSCWPWTTPRAATRPSTASARISGRTASPPAGPS